MLKPDTWDPRVKLECFLGFLIFVLVSTDIFTFLILNIIVLAALFFAGVNVLKKMARCKFVLALILFFSLLQCVSTRTGKPFFSLGSVVLVTKDGASSGLLFFAAAMLILFALLFLATSSAMDYIEALLQLHIPYRIVYVVMLWVDFVLNLGREWSVVRNSAYLRGERLKGSSLIGKISITASLCGPALIRAIETTKAVPMAMSCRGYKLMEKRTSLETLRMKDSDRVLAAILPVLFLIGMVVDFIIK